MTRDQLQQSLREVAQQALHGLPLGAGFDKFARIVAVVQKAEIAQRRADKALFLALDDLAEMRK